MVWRGRLRSRRCVSTIKMRRAGKSPARRKKRTTAGAPPKKRGSSTKRSSSPESVFNVEAFLASAGSAKAVVRYGDGDPIFTQGDAGEHVMYIRAGGVKLTVLSKTGAEAVVAMLGPGDFFGEACLAGQPIRVGSATAITRSVIVRVDKDKMV